MSDHLVRVGHLRAIQRANGWTDSELARQCGRAPQQIRAWFVGERQIGERLARALEDHLKLGRYALDARGGAMPVESPPQQLGAVQTRGATGKTGTKEVPVIRWADVVEMLDVENAKIRNKRPNLETFAPCSSKAKFIEIADDSMTPEFMEGDHVLFDPAEAPRAGDVVLVRLPSDEYFVRFFRPRTAYIFDAVPSNQNYLPLSSGEDSATVVAVMVEHRRYRRGR